MSQWKQYCRCYPQDCGTNCSSIVWPAPGPAYSGLTASSKLVSIELVEPRLPAGVWPFVFSGMHRLLHLTRLHVDDQDPDWGSAALPGSFGAADVSSLVGCCPNLCMIKEIPLQHGLHVSQLHELTALSFLRPVYGNNSFQTSQESLQGLAAVTQLRHLNVLCDGGDLTKGSLLPLTNLTALSKLRFKNGPSVDCDVRLTFQQVRVACPHA